MCFSCHSQISSYSNSSNDYGSAYCILLQYISPVEYLSFFHLFSLGILKFNLSFEADVLLGKIMWPVNWEVLIDHKKSAMRGVV